MDLITVKGRENGVELCFSRTAPLEEAEAELKRMVQEHEEFFKRAEVCVSYSGMEFSYFDEVKFEKTVKSLFGKHCDFKRQKFLTKNQLFHSLARMSVFAGLSAKACAAAKVCAHAATL